MACKFPHCLRSQVRYCCAINTPAYGVDYIRWAACPSIVSKTLRYFLSLLCIWISRKLFWRSFGLSSAFQWLAWGQRWMQSSSWNTSGFPRKRAAGNTMNRLASRSWDSLFTTQVTWEKKPKSTSRKWRERECQNSQSLLVLSLLEFTSNFTPNHWAMKMEFTHFFSQYYGM